MSQPQPAAQPTASPRTSQTPDAFRLCERAIEYARRYGTPPDPETYNVWYAYASGRSPKLNNRLEAMLSRGANPSTYDLTELNSEVLLAENDAQRLNEATNQGLSNEMEQMQRFIHSYLDSTERYEGAIDTSTKSLSAASTPDELEMMIALVIRENQRIRAQTRQLSDSLRETQGEIERLQGRLEESRAAELKDPLTGLANRRFFQRAFDAEVLAAQEKGYPLCFALADIDHFKSVNDRFGHQIGDEILKFVGGYLQDALDQHGSVSRYGGEEFAVILPDMERSQAVLLLDQVREGLAASRLVTSKSRKPIGAVTVSMGVALLKHDETGDELFVRADELLYRAKSAGRNNVQ